MGTKKSIRLIANVRRLWLSNLAQCCGAVDWILSLKNGGHFYIFIKSSCSALPLIPLQIHVARIPAHHALLRQQCRLVSPPRWTGRRRRRRRLTRSSHRFPPFLWILPLSYPPFPPLYRRFSVGFFPVIWYKLKYSRIFHEIFKFSYDSFYRHRLYW